MSIGQTNLRRSLGPGGSCSREVYVATDTLRKRIVELMLGSVAIVDTPNPR